MSFLMLSDPMSTLFLLTWTLVGTTRPPGVCWTVLVWAGLLEGDARICLADLLDLIELGFLAGAANRLATFILGAGGHFVQICSMAEIV